MLVNGPVRTSGMIYESDDDDDDDDAIASLVVWWPFLVAWLVAIVSSLVSDD